MKNRLTIGLSIGLCVMGLFAPSKPFVLAEDAPSTGRSLRDQVDKQMRAVPGVSDEYEARDPREVAAGVIQTFMLFMGSIFILLVVISGYWMLSARGEAEKVQKAKDTMLRATIGFFLCLSAYSISSFVLSKLQKTILEEPVDNPNNDCVDWLGCDDNT